MIGKKVVGLTALVLAGGLLSGCASNAKLEEIRMLAEEAKMASQDAAAKADQAAQSAGVAQQSASNAEQMANQAMDTSLATDEKIERMFKKSMQK